jgi:hypothetical protein
VIAVLPPANEAAGDENPASEHAYGNIKAQAG